MKLSSSFVTAALAVLATACGQRQAAFGPERRVPLQAQSAVFGLDQKQRFQLQDMGSTQGRGSSGTAATGFEGDAPADWQLLPPTDMRQLNYKVAGVGECYLTTGNLSGGVLANANRWVQNQFGQPPLSQPEFDKLSRHALLGQSAALIEVAGAFKGMNGQGGDDFKLLGLIAGTDDDMVTLKFIGPRPLVDAQRDAFLAFAASVRRARGGGAGASAAPTGDANGFHADTPAGWQPAPPSEFRQLNWRVAGDGECYLTAGNVRGGMLANVNRWVSMQFGKEPLTPQQFAALPHHPLLGQQALLVEVEGSFGGMGGAAAKDGYKLLGLVGGTDDDMTTLKFIGPKALVDAQKAAFLAVAASIARGGAPQAAGGTPKAPTLPPASGSMPNDAAHAGVGTMPAGHPGDAAAPFAATVGKDWTALGDTGSRMLRHRFGTQGECYVGQLGGELAQMLGIWYGEMSATPPDAAAIAALPRVPMLGGDAVLLDLKGSYQSMGGQSLPDARSLVAAVVVDGAIVFAKCLGPATEVEAQRDAFLEFVKSLRRSQ